MGFKVVVLRVEERHAIGGSRTAPHDFEGKGKSWVEKGPPGFSMPEKGKGLIRREKHKKETKSLVSRFFCVGGAAVPCKGGEAKYGGEGRWALNQLSKT